jgi:hypothetical protein
MVMVPGLIEVVGMEGICHCLEDYILHLLVMTVDSTIM